MHALARGLSRNAEDQQLGSCRVAPWRARRAAASGCPRRKRAVQGGSRDETADASHVSSPISACEGCGLRSLAWWLLSFDLRQSVAARRLNYYGPSLLRARGHSRPTFDTSLRADRDQTHRRRHRPCPTAGVPGRFEPPPRILEAVSIGFYVSPSPARTRPEGAPRRRCVAAGGRASRPIRGSPARSEDRLSDHGG